MATIKFREDQVVVSQRSEETNLPLAMTVEEAVRWAFVAKGWNGGRPPENWQFFVIGSDERVHKGIPKDDWADDSDTIVVQIPIRKEITYPGC